jgi:hypothetical protein
MNDEYFYKNKSSKIDGFNPYCKECTKRRSMKWQKDNWDKLLGYMKKENAKPERKLKHQELYWERKEKGYFKDYYDENKDRFKEYNENRKSKNHDISKQEWIDCKTYFNNSCAYCGMSIEEHKEIHKQDLHREHVEPYGANDISNCIPSCKVCNVRKKLLSLNDWYNESNINYTNERLLRINRWLNEDHKKYKS